MQKTIRDLTQEWRDGDAERLARFMNETGHGWPGGGWDPETPEDAERRMREQHHMAVYVVEEAGEFISYCSLYAKPNERDRGYVGFLSALPDYHGKGYGKAVLLRAVEHVYNLGLTRVNLDTWPGNLKAVPLYKKSGFMWSPESLHGVEMENFTPAARRHPCAQEYFSKHDWYTTLKRDVDLTADDHKRGKVRVYPYEWQSGEDRLRMVFDRQSWGLLEIETNEFCIGCSLEDEKLIAGIPHPIKWQIINHGTKPLEIALMTAGDDGVNIDYTKLLRVTERAELETQFEIDPAIPEKEQEPSASIIRTNLLVNGTPCMLAAGFKARQAMYFSLDGDNAFLWPGRPKRVIVQAWSELDQPAQVNMLLSGTAVIEPTRAVLDIPAKGSAEFPVTLTAADSGVQCVRLDAEVTVNERTIRPKKEELHLHALTLGECIGHVEKKRVVLESALLRVNIDRHGGNGRVIDKLRNRQVAIINRPEVGPPFAWDEFFDKTCEARVEHTNTGVTTVLVTHSNFRPGLCLERRLTLSNTPLIEIKDTLINGTSARLSGRLDASAYLNGDRMIAAPTRHGILRDLRNGAGRRPMEHDLSDKPDDWPESWYAVEDTDGIAAGFLWDQAERVSMGWGCSVSRAFPAADPGQSTTPGPVYLFAGDGDYFTVQQWWQTIYGNHSNRPLHNPKTRKALEFGLRPKTVVVHGQQVKAKLAVESIGKLKLDGKIALAVPESLCIQPQQMEFRGVCEAKPKSIPTIISRSKGEADGVYVLESTLKIDRAVYHERQHLILMGDPQAPLTVEKSGNRSELFCIRNGVFALTIAPEFQGSAISLLRNGEELLMSAYPEAKPLSWENPWFGGIQPSLGVIGRELANEKFTVRQIQRRGNQGILWQGVRLTCKPKREEGRHHAMTLDYLLAPGSSIIAIAITSTRRTDTAGWASGGFQYFPVLGGNALDAVLSGQHDPRTSRLHCEYGGGFGGKKWVTAENPSSEEAIVLACHGKECGAGAQTYAKEAYALNGDCWGSLEAREARETVFFLGFTHQNTARELAEALSELETLP